MKKRTKKEILRLKNELEEKMEITNIKEDISCRLKSYMEIGNWTNRSLAEVTGLSDTTIGGILNETQNVTVENLHRICLALDEKIYVFLNSLGWHQPQD